jgi:serine palmitoyltransferase
MVNSDRPYTVDDNVRFINSTVNSVYELVALIPGSDIIMNYLKESYQHDPFRVVLELFLVFFAIKYMLAKRYKPNDNSVKLTKKASFIILSFVIASRYLSDNLNFN